MKISEKTPETKAKQIAHCQKYLAFLEVFSSDPKKKEWCKLYAPDSPYDEYAKAIYDDFMKDAITNGMVPYDYVSYLQEDIFNSFTKEALEHLTYDELIATIAHCFREEHFIEGSLVQSVGDGTMLMLYKEVLTRIKDEAPRKTGEYPWITEARQKEDFEESKRRQSYYAWILSNPTSKVDLRIKDGTIELIDIPDWEAYAFPVHYWIDKENSNKIFAMMIVKEFENLLKTQKNIDEMVNMLKERGITASRWVEEHGSKNPYKRDMIEEIVESLRKKDKFFVSEAHLQTEFIIEAARLYPENKYYPEMPPKALPEGYEESFDSKSIFFDLVIRCPKQTILVEFKYLTKAYEEVVDGFPLEVKNQGAHDIRRYDCWKDISRIEKCVKDSKTGIDCGYFILITNNHLYWDKPVKKDAVDIDFSICEGKHPASTKKWGEGAGKGTVKGREKPIVIENDYSLEYKPFYKEFKSLVVKIKK
ncbi:MAG: hypothetical protein IKQ34_02675 [Bacilli bacterium]|nr:hypothetical protein [Bacilli bacterium]